MDLSAQYRHFRFVNRQDRRAQMNVQVSKCCARCFLFQVRCSRQLLRAGAARLHLLLHVALWRFRISGTLRSALAFIASCPRECFDMSCISRMPFEHLPPVHGGIIFRYSRETTRNISSSERFHRNAKKHSVYARRSGPTNSRLPSAQRMILYPLRGIIHSKCSNK